MSDNTQLPDVVITEIYQLVKDKTEIEREYWNNTPSADPDRAKTYVGGYSKGVKDGATEYAIKLHQAEQENKELKGRIYKYEGVLTSIKKWGFTTDGSKWNGNHKEVLKLIIGITNLVLLAGKEGKAEEIEYMPVHPEDVIKPGCPSQIPMHLLNEDQAQINHRQTLKRLKERGGLGVKEILAIVYGKKWAHFRDLKWDDALKMLNDILNKEVTNGK